MASIPSIREESKPNLLKLTLTILVDGTIEATETNNGGKRSNFGGARWRSDGAEYGLGKRIDPQSSGRRPSGIRVAFPLPPGKGLRAVFADDRIRSGCRGLYAGGFCARLEQTRPFSG